MSILELVDSNNEILYTKTLPVEEITSVTEEFVKDLIETSREIGGYGLAAPQVGISKQMFVYRKTAYGDYTVVINPKVVVMSGKMISKGEGCLSLPGFRADLKRFKTVVITYTDLKGNTVRLKNSTRIEALILQHELDHLAGKLINGNNQRCV